MSIRSSSLSSHFLHFPSFLSPSSKTPAFLLPKLPFPIPRSLSYTLKPTPPLSQPPSQQLQEAEILRLVAESEDNSIPCVRTFENDLARLSLVGSVRLDQAVTAAAADGGRASDEHLDAGMPTMVVETLFPGPADEHSTVSTRLFLPTEKVKEKARRLRRTLNDDMLSTTSSENILAMTFRQVVMQQLWNFELVLFRPGTERNMEDLENPREVPASFILRSSNEQVISVLAEAVGRAALQDTKRHFIDEFWGNTSGNFFDWFRKPRQIVSKDSSVTIHVLFEHEIVENAKSLLDVFHSEKDGYRKTHTKNKYNWWMPLVHSKLEKIGGPEFVAWTIEHVPAYRLQTNAEKVKDMKVEGWRNSADDQWEVLLTHSQMVRLAEILDTYYEDIYTLPDKDLSFGLDAKVRSSNQKQRSSLTNSISFILASGIFIVTISTLGQFLSPYRRKGQISGKEIGFSPSTHCECILNDSLDTSKIQEFSVCVVKKIKDAFGWLDDIMTDSEGGAWIGEVPNFLKATDEANHISTESSDSASKSADSSSPALEIASYQVVLSTDGKVVGFQPTSRVGVNNWATNPLAKELNDGKKLSPGLIEPRLKIRLPEEVVVLELLTSVNSEAQFALARPFR